jgi:hypothetical protein
MSSYKNIVVVGASGSTGKIIIDGLTSTSTFNVTVLSRKESKATYPGNVTVRTTDFSLGDLSEALKGQEVVISALGVEGFDQQQKLVDASVRAGIKRFLPSEFSSSSEDPVVLELFPLFEVKKNLIEYLKSKEKDGLSWTGLATGLLFDWGIANGFLGYDIRNRSAKIWDDGNKRFTLTNEKQLARAIISTLQHPEETRNRYLYIYSVITTQNEILHYLEQATGGKWNVERTSTDAEVAEARKRLSAGDFSGGFILVHATSYGDKDGLRANYAKEENSGNGILGLEIEDVGETVAKVLGK